MVEATPTDRATSPLFRPFTAGTVEFKNRIVMAPMTRSRAGAGDVPTELTAEYYAQRSGSGLIVSEATETSEEGKGYLATPGLYTEDQVAGWKRVTEAVHAKGGKMFAQLMHTGRISHVANRRTDAPIVAPSAVKPNAQMFTAAGMVDIESPKALETNEIPGVVDQFARAAANAIKAGFDGVELHGASGYLVHQFLSKGTNHRSDAYGGSPENRARFAVETLQAIIATVGDSKKVGIKLSPTIPFNDIDESEEVGETYAALMAELDRLDLAYVHVMRVPHFAEATGKDTATFFRGHYQGTLGIGGGLTFDEADQILRAGHADFAVFGNLFISNPDLPERFRTGAELSPADPSSFYGGDAKGYTDYPTLAGVGAH